MDNLRALAMTMPRTSYFTILGGATEMPFARASQRVMEWLLQMADKVLAAPVKVEPADKPRRGRMNKADSEAKRAQLLATIRQHRSLIDDPAALASQVGVSESTARRWIEDEQQKYLESKAANPADGDDE